MNAEPIADRGSGEKCQSCDCENEGKPLHTCPYREEIKGDETTLCNCCDECRRQCAQDI